jgi:hypothetical protein
MAPQLFLVIVIGGQRRPLAPEEMLDVLLAQKHRYPARRRQVLHQVKPFDVNQIVRANGTGQLA